jgi:hypothetical protein
LIGAGLLSVVVFPATALGLLQPGTARPAAAAAAPDDTPIMAM